MGQRKREEIEYKQNLLQEKRRAVEKETERLAAWEQRIKEDKERKQRAEEERLKARKLAEEQRLKEEEAEEKARQEREAQRQKAREELRRCRESAYIKPQEMSITEDKENQPIKQAGGLNTRDISTDESLRKATYSHVKQQSEADSAYVKEAESAIAASHKATQEAERLKSRIETSMQDGLSASRASRRPVSMYETSSSPVYYARDSSARRRSRDSSNIRREVDDDLADEVELIRLAADLNSRRLLAEQKRDVGVGSSRSRIRAVLDKQRNQREDEERARQERRESQDFNRYLWVYR